MVGDRSAIGCPPDCTEGHKMHEPSSCINPLLSRRGQPFGYGTFVRPEAAVSGELIAAYAGGSVAQAALVAGGAVRCVPGSLRALRHPLFAAVPLLARIGLVALALVVAMVVLTVHDNHSVSGQIAALGLVAASCTVLGALLVAVTPPRWLGVGIAATAAVDLVLVASGFLAPATHALNSAGVTDSLPQLQRVELGPLTMGFADPFLPALVGALLATRARTRHWVALLTLCFALAAGLVFLVADRLPATVAVALALLVVEGAGALAPLWRTANA